MISCKEATDFISRKEEGKLSLRRRWQLWQHLAVCTFCRLFYKQNTVLIKNVPHTHEHIHATLSAEEKKSIVSVLEDN